MTHHTDADLLPCPFCGGKAEAKKPDPSYEFTLIKCQECDAQTDERIDFADAAEAWNRRAPAAPVPQSESVAYLWQHCETGRTRVVMPDMVVTADANWIVVGPLYLAAAPRPPEHMSSEHSAPMCGAAPKVDPIAWYVTGCSTMLDEHDAKAEAKRCGGCAQAVPLYTEQQVRDLLAAHGIQERST